MTSKIAKSSFKPRSYHQLSNNESDNLLGHYLAGLIEGDGSSLRGEKYIYFSIIVPKTILRLR